MIVDLVVPPEALAGGGKVGDFALALGDDGLDWEAKRDPSPDSHPGRFEDFPSLAADGACATDLSDIVLDNNRGGLAEAPEASSVRAFSAEARGGGGCSWGLCGAGDALRERGRGSAVVTG